MEQRVDVARVEREDPAVTVDGEHALGNPATQGLHAYPDPDSGRRQ